MTTGTIQGKYVIGECTKVGDGRRYHEDRVFSDELISVTGQKFIVGVVADGVGSAGAGFRGAQLAIDTVKNIIQNTQDSPIPDMIEHACREANREVYEENQRSEGDGLTTLVVAIIHNDRCFIGNVGDSRAYWIQGGDKGKMLQLTRDHSYYNMHGGSDPDGEDAGVLVNAIGREADVYVDLGFYLDGERGDAEKALHRGLNGLPLKPGDSIMLCSDGLIKNDPMGSRYATDAEIVDAIRTEYETNTAAVKMVSAALGRRPDDNVSAVTIQYLTPAIIASMKAHSASAKRMQTLKRIGASAFALVSMVLIVILGFRASRTPKTVMIIHTTTALPTITPTKPVDPGKARVDYAAPLSNVVLGQELTPNTSITAGGDGVLIRVGEQGGYTGVMYWFGNSVGILNFDVSHMMPALTSGALYVNPGRNKTEVFFSQWAEITATVEGSRMIVEITNEGIWIYCFEGDCLLDPGGGKDPFKIQAGYKRLYALPSAQAGTPEEMTYDEKWAWNIKCNYCMGGWDGLPTPTLTPRVEKEQPTQEKKEDSQNPTPTNVPPTATNVPPTATNVPPTATNVPPTETNVPPTATDIPITSTSYP